MKNVAMGNEKYKVQLSMVGIFYFCFALLKLKQNDIIPDYAPPWLDASSIRAISLSLSTQSINTLIPNGYFKNTKREILNVVNVPAFMFKWKQEYSMNNLDKSSIFIAINIDGYKLINRGQQYNRNCNFNICDCEILLQIPQCNIS